MSTPWERFVVAARRGTPDQVPVALIVDSPWLPGYAGIDTRDYYLFPDRWYAINRGLLERFPDAVWIPGWWIEYGMAVEPSAFGAKPHFYADRPPSVEPVVADLGFWAREIEPADPREDGLMPLVVRQYEALDERLRAEGLGVRMVCARGPMTVASYLMGVMPLMEGMALDPDGASHVLDVISKSIIRWLQAQLDAIHAPEGIMVLDDLVGMVSRRHYQAIIEPHLRRIFDAFDGLIRVYHNDTPCEHLLPALADAHFDVFNFSHVTDVAAAKAAMGHCVALMGNVPPLDLGVRGSPDEVYRAAWDVLERGAPGGGLILSFGGGVAPGTPPENIDALLQAARDWGSGK
jgi:uroporphyrinogen-III decarboxylase